MAYSPIMYRGNFAAIACCSVAIACGFWRGCGSWCGRDRWTGRLSGHDGVDRWLTHSLADVDARSRTESHLSMMKRRWQLHDSQRHNTKQHVPAIMSRPLLVNFTRIKQVSNYTSFYLCFLFHGRVTFVNREYKQLTGIAYQQHACF